MLKELKSSADSHHEYVMTCEDKAVVLYILCHLFYTEAKGPKTTTVQSFRGLCIVICTF